MSEERAFKLASLRTAAGGRAAVVVGDVVAIEIEGLGRLENPVR